MQVALRTEQVIALRDRRRRFLDPLAGSDPIEHLSNEIVTRAADYIEQIDAMGGALAAIESGFVRGEIQQAAYQYQRARRTRRSGDRRRQQFTMDGEVKPAPLRVDPAV